MTVEARPNTWVASDYTVHLDLVDAKTGNVFLTLSEPVEGNGDAKVTTTITWDQKLADGTPVPEGSCINAYPRIELTSIATVAANATATGGPVLDTEGPIAIALGVPCPSLSRWPPYVPQPSDRPQPVGEEPGTERPATPNDFGPRFVSNGSSTRQNYVRLPGVMSRFVDLNSGHYMHPMTDLTIQTRGLPIVVSRVYRSEYAGVAPTFGWQWNFQQELYFYSEERLARRVPGRSEVPYRYIFVGEPGSIQSEEWQPTRPDETNIISPLGGGRYALQMKDGTKFIYRRVNNDSRRAYLEQIVDRNGNALTYTWNGLGTELQKISDPVGREVNFTWNGSVVQSMSDWTGRTVQYNYQENGSDLLLNSVSYPGNHEVTYGYQRDRQSSGFGQASTGSYQLYAMKTTGIGLQGVIAAQAGRFRESTNANGVRSSGGVILDPGSGDRTARLVNTTSAGARTWQNALDENYRTRAVTDPLDHTSNFEYDENDQLVRAINAEQREYEFTWGEDRNVTSIKDHLGRFTYFDWTTEGGFQEQLLLKRIKRPMGENTVFGYDSRGNVTSVRDPRGKRTRYKYNENGQLEKTIDPLGQATNYFYDANGYLIRVRLPADEGEPRPTWNFTVDDLGRRPEGQEPARSRLAIRLRRPRSGQAGLPARDRQQSPGFDSIQVGPKRYPRPDYRRQRQGHVLRIQRPAATDVYDRTRAGDHSLRL